MKKDIVEVASLEGECMLEEKNLSRRDVLRGAMAVGFGLLASNALFSSPSASAEPSAVTATKKMSHASVKYQNAPKGEQKCATCARFVAPNSCNLVEGPINPEDWCILWAKKT